MRGNEVQLHIGNLLLRDGYKKQLYISQTERAKALYDSVQYAAISFCATVDACMVT